MTGEWVVYILSCSDDSYYTGITNNLDKRIAKHNSGSGAKYTAARLPVKLLKSFPAPNKSIALKIEYFIKQLKREDKLKFELQDYYDTII